MRILGLEITRAKALSPINDWRQGWRVIHEPYAGAWQKNDPLSRDDLTCYPTLYACLNRIATDVGKLPFALKREDEYGIWRVVKNAAYDPVLRKPNGYQTQQQFRESWLLSKLTDGNTYILKQRDARGVVVALHVLDPHRTQPMVSDAGRVFYQLNYASSQNLLPEDYPEGGMMVPASEVIHDRINCLHHPLIGVPPLCAAAIAAGKNVKILRNSSAFFSNSANPGGLVSGPAGLSDDDADKLQQFFNENFTGDKSGKIAVVGADLKFTPFAFKAADSQLVEQMRYSDEQICQPFGIPPFKVGIGSIPAGLGVDAINQLYYADALQAHIESMENLLDEGLGIARPEGVELDLWPLLRMDLGKQADVETKLTAGGIKTPNEGRHAFGLAPLEGGDTVYMQQQDFPLDQVRLNRIVPGETDVPDSAAGVDESRQESMNGAQVTALQGIIFAVAQGQLDSGTARAMIQVAFPLVTDEQIDAMLANAENLTPPDDFSDEQAQRAMQAASALNTIKAVESARSEALR